MVQEAGKLTPEEVDARLGALLPRGGKARPPRRLSQEAVDRRLDALIPEAPGPLASFGGQALGALGSMAGGMAATARGIGSVFGDEDVETPFFSGIEESLGGLQEEVYPAASRGRGSVFTEDIPGGLGQAVTMLGPGVAAKGLGAGAGMAESMASVASGLQIGTPLYYDVLHTTGDKEKAYVALLSGFGLGQLERLGLGKIFAEVDDVTGGAAEKWILSRAIGARAARMGAREAHQEAVEQALGDAVASALTDENRMDLQRVLDVYGPSSGVGFLLGPLAGGGRIDQPEQGTSVSEPGEPLQSRSVSEGAAASPAPAPEGKWTVTYERPGGNTITVTGDAAAHAGMEQILREETEPSATATAETEDLGPRDVEIEESPVPAQEEQAPPESAVAESQPAATPETTSKKPPDETQEEIVQLHAGLPPIGRGGRKLMRGLKQLVTTGFRPRGAAPKEAHRALEIARGEIMSEGEEVRVRAKELNAALTKAKLKGPKADALIQEALTDPVALEKLPGDLKGPVTAIRDHVDRLSRILVEEGVVDGPIADVIVRNQGIYLRRSYKAHHDPEWMNNVPEDVRNRTVSLLRSWEEFAGASDQEINAELDSWLTEAKENAENPWGHLARGKLGRKDLSIFKKRKDLPVEIREFLGEVKDPRTNYAQSVLRMSATIARHRAFRTIRAKGLRKWLSEKPSGKNTARLSSDENRALAPLNGLYTTPEIKKALTAQPTENFGPILDAMTKANALMKGVKTVWNPDQIGRNFLGNTTNAISNGTKPIPGRRAWKLALGRNLSSADLEARKELIRLGVLEESAHGAEFRDIAKIESIRPEDLANEAYWAKWKKIPNGLRVIYELMDGSFKVEHFKKEYDAHRKAGFSEKASTERAADLVRDLNPTYSRIFPIVQKMRRGLGPIWGGYLAFHSEQFRILGNRLRVIAEEVRSSNPDVRAMGYKRAATSIIGHSIVPASVMGISMLQGIDAEEDKERREFIPPWDIGSQIIWLGKKRGGTYIDLSDIDPHTLWTDPLSRILAGEDVDEVLKRAIKEYSGPFTQPAPLMEAMWELYTGRDEYGRPIKDPFAHLWKEVRPSTLTQLAKAKERGAAATTAAMLGFRQHQASEKRNKKDRE